MKTQTQWAAQFAVASELCKRGYEVAFTMGNNTPVADLTVISPNKKMFLVDVKGLYQKNPWLVKQKEEREDLFYVLAFVPADKSNEFFIMTQTEANEAIEADFKKRKSQNSNFPGFVWNVAVPHKDQWKKLPK